MNEIKIIYEDDDFAVLDKPSGITVNRSETTVRQITLQDFIDKTIKLNTTLSDSDFLKRSGIVHRLDKETSGAIIIAKNESTFLNLQAQFKERKVEKTYLALAHGKVIPLEGEIKAPVGRLPWNRKRFGILAGGRDSVTFYKVLKYYNFDKIKEKDLSYLELYPKTGRTHQIRVHLKYINRPIFSDELYSGRKTAREDRKYLERLFLHAASISFFHPKTSQNVLFTSPLPNELEGFLKYLS